MKILTSVVLSLIRSYRFVFAGWGSACRFWPSCSHYMEEAIQRKGLARGLLQGSARLLKCHPFHPGGADPVS